MALSARAKRSQPLNQDQAECVLTDKARLFPARAGRSQTGAITVREKWLQMVAFHRKRQDLAEKRATLNSTGCFGGQLATIFDEIARVARADRVKIGKLVQTWPDEYGAAMASIKITAARFARETNTSA